MWVSVCVCCPATGGQDYIVIDGEIVRASEMPNGTVTTTVTVFDDDIVELEEIFTVVGQVAATGLIADGTGRDFPVVFNSPVICTIPVEDGNY